MKTIKQETSAEITEKKSKFISDVFYVKSSKEAEERIQEVSKKYHDAKHHCFAYRVIEESKIVERASDDGEPSGTAGAPMLQFLSKNDLANVLVVVTRYFGGTLLGTGGLIRAYTQVASDGIQKAGILNIEIGEKIKIPVTYQNISYLQYYCRKNNIRIIRTNFEDEMYVIVEVTIEEKQKMISEFEEKQFDIEKIEVIEKGYLQKINSKEEM